MGRDDGFKAILENLAKIRPSTKDALEPVYHWTWSDNRFAGGAFAYWKPGQITSFAKHIADPLGRLHFAGEHTAGLARGMEGAMESGERVAMEVLALI